MFFQALIFLILIGMAGSESLYEKLLGKGAKISATGPSTSAIAVFMQRNKLVSRVCRRVKSAQQFKSGIVPQSLQLSVRGCIIQMVGADELLSSDGEVCPGERACSPIMSEVIEVRTATKLTDVSSALGCTCVSRDSGCQRRRSLRVFYRGTRFQRTVDVGTCGGSCKLAGVKSQHKTCQPLAKKTISIRGPNGRKCVKVVEKCGCVPSCYRVSYKKAFNVLVHDQKRNATTTKSKVIDVGRCTGSCSGHVQGKCLYWVNPQRTPSGNVPDKICLLRSKSREKGCYAKTTRRYTLNTAAERNKVVMAIKTCACL